MKQSWLVMVFTALMLSACGNKSEVESAGATAPPPAGEQNIPVVAEQAAPPAVEEKAVEVTAPVSVVIEPTPAPTPAPVKTPVPAPVEIKKPVKESHVSSDKALSQEEGLALAGKSGCLGCHKIETKVVGPAWRDVSKRYKGVSDAKALLVAKVKAGGGGNWTNVTGGVPMPPSSPRVSDENIEKLVIFVLSL